MGLFYSKTPRSSLVEYEYTSYLSDLHKAKLQIGCMVWHGETTISNTENYEENIDSNICKSF